MCARSAQRVSDRRLDPLGDHEGEYHVQEHRRHGHRQDQHSDRRQARFVGAVEGPAVERLLPQVVHRQPQPDGRQQLDRYQPPVAEQPSQAAQQHRERSDRVGEGREEPARAAEL